MPPTLPDTVWTIGHSTLPIDDFLQRLQDNGIEAVCDVRRYAGSRRNPQFDPAALVAALRARHLRYIAIPELGGRRRPRPDSHNTVWRNAGFRGYADYMETADFERALDRLVDTAARWRTAILCAEAVWWRCHRSLIADALKSRGVRVLHILGPDQVDEHPYSKPARIVAGRLHYGDEPGPRSGSLFDDDDAPVARRGVA